MMIGTYATKEVDEATDRCRLGKVLHSIYLLKQRCNGAWLGEVSIDEGL